jgi:MFS family permease
VSGTSPPAAPAAARSMILPLALAQFIASYAATNMNVAISAIANDLGTDAIGVQTAITLFTLTMASLMIPGSKLTDIWGRKRCFTLGLGIYGAGGLIAALAPGLGLLIFGYSILEGIGSALMIPPIYILVTVTFPDIKARARYFGVISGAGGLGAAAGPLIGGLVTSALSWRASFVLQVLVIAWIVILARKITDPGREGRKPRFDFTGAVLSAAGLFFVVLGLLESRTYGFFVSRKDFSIGNTVVIPKGWISPVWLLVGIGALFLLWFFLHIHAAEKKGRDVLLRLRLFRNRVANLALGTQVIQWLVLQGSFFVISLYLQEVRKYDAIQTGLMLTPATIGILAASAAADRLARRHTQRSLIMAGFLATTAGMVLLLVLVRQNSSNLSYVPGLLLFGIGIGVMLTSSVNVVQSSFPDADQGDISGLSRSVSNLGSSFGTALVGSILVAAKFPAGKPFAAALATLLVITVIGLVIAFFMPRQPTEAAQPARAEGLRLPRLLEPRGQRFHPVGQFRRVEHGEVAADHGDVKRQRVERVGAAREQATVRARCIDDGDRRRHQSGDHIGGRLHKYPRLVPVGRGGDSVRNEGGRIRRVARLEPDAGEARRADTVGTERPPVVPFQVTRHQVPPVTGLDQPMRFHPTLGQFAVLAPAVPEHEPFGVPARPGDRGEDVSVDRRAGPGQRHGGLADRHGTFAQPRRQHLLQLGQCAYRGLAHSGH